MTTSSPAPIGMVAHYNMLERLEASGPGDLYRARDTHRGRTVAVRVLPAEYAERAESRDGVLAEARACIALSHPNITTLFDAGEHGGCVYLAFEFGRGRSLRAEMAGRPMNVRRAIEIAIQVANAVAQAHAAGFTLRGLSPESVLVTEKGHAKIPAFPLASLIGFDSAKGGLDLHDCESPEEARGDKPDERSDVYSVGAIAYEMLTTRVPPRRGASAPSEWNARVPKQLDQVVLKALAPNPDLRFHSAAGLAAELRSVAATLGAPGAMEDEEHDSPGIPASSRSLVLAAAVVLVIVALAVTWWLIRS